MLVFADHCCGLLLYRALSFVLCPIFACTECENSLTSACLEYFNSLSISFLHFLPLLIDGIRSATRNSKVLLHKQNVISISLKSLLSRTVARGMKRTYSVDNKKTLRVIARRLQIIVRIKWFENKNKGKRMRSLGMICSERGAVSRE